jgi:type I restriction enzyme S subunit
MAVGRVVLFDKPVAINQDLKAIYLTDSVYKNYVHHWFDFKEKELFKIASGSTVRGITLDVLKGISIDLPPLNEQQKIAEILTSVDEVIENTQSQIDKLEDLKKATMNELLTKGIGHTEFKETEIGRIPKSWKVKNLGEFCVVKGGKRLPKGYGFESCQTEYPYIRVSDFVDGTVSEENLKYVSEDVRQHISRYTISKDDIYISIAGTIGIVGQVPVKFDGALLTENAAKIIVKDKFVDNKFLAILMTSQHIKRQFNNATGIGGGVPKLALFRIESTTVSIPPMLEQISIKETIVAIDNAITNKKQRLKKIKLLKSSFMQDLLTGKVRVKVN